MKTSARVIAATLIALSSHAESALVERLGGLAFYDTVSNLTWLTDANFAATSGTASGGGSGLMNWNDATQWASNLNVSGVTDWRLPKTLDVNNDGPTGDSWFQGVDFGFNLSAHSEMSNLFYNVLGNKGYYNTDGSLSGCATHPPFCLTNSGPFLNLVNGTFWSSTEFAPDTSMAWVFQMQGGNQGYMGKFQDEDGTPMTASAWAVREGDVAPVPLPAALWLFGSGLMGLAGFNLRKRK